MRKYIFLFIIWLILTCLSAVVAAAIINPFADYQLSRHGVSTEGWVTAKDPENHRIIRYTYIVGSHRYNGVGHGGNGNPGFENINLGQQVLVFYDPQNPQTSSMGYPNSDFQVNMGGVFFVALVLPLVVVINLYRLVFFRRR